MFLEFRDNTFAEDIQEEFREAVRLLQNICLDGFRVIGLRQGFIGKRPCATARDPDFKYKRSLGVLVIDILHFQSHHILKGAVFHKR